MKILSREALKILPVLGGLLLSPAMAETADQAVNGFVDAAGWSRSDVEKIDAQFAEALSPSEAMVPGGAISPIEKALLLMDVLEEKAERSRTSVKISQIMSEEGGRPQTFTLVDVERYNLGAAIHAEAVASYGQENVGSLEDFGAGPHVARRFVFTPMMGTTSSLVEAARHEISDKEAEAADCAGIACLDISVAVDDIRPWSEGEGLSEDWQAPYEKIQEDLTVAGHIAAEFAVVSHSAEVSDGRFSWTGMEQPEAIRGAAPMAFMVIDKNLGQDSGTDARFGMIELNDDAIAELWWRRAEIGGDVYWFTSVVDRVRH